MKRQIVIAIMAIVLLLVTNGTALDRIQVDNKQIMAEKRPLETATELYYGVILSIPYNATENHATSFGATITDQDHRPIAISGMIYWHNANASSTKNDTAINNAWVENAVIANTIQYLRQMNVSGFNANRSIIENEIQAALSVRGEYGGEYNVVIDNISLNNISFLMIDDYKCYWENNASILLADSLKKDMAAASERETRNKIAIAAVIGIVIGIVIDEYRNRRS